jgi:AcrR family transcriptional regulator
MITVSTSKIAARNYHHGDLRTSLIEAGLSALEGTDADAVSLRELARKVGVSATAVYRHFPDKKALLAALAAEGIARLGTAQRIASEQAGGGGAGFAATGQAYVRFALDNPALFRLAFTHGDHAGGSMIANDEAWQLLRTYAESFAGTDARRLQLQAWAVAHGLAMLMLDGLIPADDKLIKSVIDQQTLFPAQPGSSSDASP